MAATQLHKINYPGLTPSSFGADLRKAFENIDSNFQKLASLGLTTGESGTPAVWVPYNLNSVFCKISADAFTSDYLNSEHINAIEKSFKEYNKITDHDREQYISECKALYESLIDGLPDDSVVVKSKSGTEWKHKWELSDSGFIFNNLIPSDQDQKQYIKQYLNFIPGDILVAGNYNAETKAFTKLSTTAHIYIDPRFRNPMTIAGDVVTESISSATDCSCVVYGGLDNDEFEFKYVYAFPRIHYKDGGFYLSANGIDTNIPLTGATGKAGKDSQFAAVQIKDVESYYDQINGIVYGETNNDEVNISSKLQSSANNNQGTIDPETETDSTINKKEGGDSKIFEIGNKIGNEDPISNPELLDGCPALIFPPAGYTANAYVTLYWVGYLKYDNDNNTLTAYCGRENLVMVDLYEHSFGGMMMGLDMYEQSKARPVGNAPWTKPRGLMLPIGARYIGSDRNEYWDPTAGYPYNGTTDTNHFGAHLIYSKKLNGNLKTELHIGSIDDYRRIGATDDQSGNTNYPSEVIANKVAGTKLFIDEPVTITNYGASNNDGYESTTNVLFTNMGSSEVKGYLSVGNSGNWQDAEDAGVVTADKFIKRIDGTGRILLANGEATCEYKTDDDNATPPIVPSSPIRIKNSEMGPQEVNFEFMTPENKGDGSHYFLGDIKSLIPEIKMKYAGGYQILIKKGQRYDMGNSLTLTVDSFNTDWTDDEANKAIPTNGPSIPSPGIGNNYNEANDGIRGVYFWYTMGEIVYAKVILAANGKVIDESSVDTFGLPITSSKTNEIPRFDDRINLTNNSNILPKPLFAISQFWGAQSGLHCQYASDGHGLDNWKGDKDGKIKGAGVSCKITKEGEILLSGAQTRQLFSYNTEVSPNSNKNKYIEFNFIYPIASTSTSKIPTATFVGNEEDPESWTNTSNMTDEDITTKLTALSDKYGSATTINYYGENESINVTDYTVDDPNWSIEDTTIIHNHYWKCPKMPNTSTNINSLSDHSIDTINNEWYDDINIWYLIKATSPAVDLSQLSMTYGEDVKDRDDKVWINSDDWSFSEIIPAGDRNTQDITYQWLGDPNDDTYDIISYLRQTQLAYSTARSGTQSEQSVGCWIGKLFEDLTMNYSDGAMFTYSGFRGAVEVSCNDNLSTTDKEADMTIECWNHDLSARIYKHYSIVIGTTQQIGGGLSINGDTISITPRLTIQSANQSGTYDGQPDGPVIP